MKETWKLLDKIDKKLNNQYSILDILDEIEEKLSVYTLDNNYATQTDINKFKRYVLSNLDKISINDKQEAKHLLNRLKIKNNEIVRFIIQIIYSKKQNELDELENQYASELVEDTYEREVSKLEQDGIKIMHRPTYVEYAFFLLALPNARGYIWKDYNESMKNYNADETYRHLLVNGTKGLKDLLLKQKRRLINKKKDQSQEDKWSGAFDEEMVGIVNQTKLKIYQDAKIEQCKFIAVVDDKTTRMCDSLNNQIFNINEINKYDRYSALDDRVVRYTTMGLKIGDNLPPINNHFHWCRSTITYQLGEQK